MRFSRSFTVGSDHPCLSGHFPGNPVVPGVLILEEVMQGVAEVDFPRVWSKVKFLSPVFSGERVDVYLDSGPSKVFFECRVAERVVATGTVQPTVDKRV